jgi:D-alanyl-D-alanine carboxypeptidase (penicillin-binding protein 5/6)
MRVRSKARGTGLDLAIAVALMLTAAWAFAPRPAETVREAAPAPFARRAVCDATPARGGSPFAPLAIERNAAPRVTASSVAVIDAATGRVMYGRHMHERRAPASTTKIMTALLSVEAIADENAAVVSSTDASSMVDSSVMGLWPAAEVSLRDLLYGLMLPSGNDAAIELARNLAPSEQTFVDVMNERAAVMGLRDTHFTNPHGLDQPGHYSSAYDMAVLGRFAMQHPRFREIAGTPAYRFSWPFDYDVHNGNSLLGAYPGASGVKIGWTEAAGWTFVASAQRDGREVIVSLMNSADRDADAAALLDWAFASPHWQGAGWSPPSAPRRLLDHPRIDGLFRIGAYACGAARED